MNTVELPNGLYYFTKEGNQYTPHKCPLFDDEELFRLNAAVQIMKRFFKNLKRSFASSEAYNEFVEAAHSVKSDNPYARAEVDRRFRAFIFEWKLYTEHWKNYIKEIGDSVYLDEFVVGYNDLFKSLMDEAFPDKLTITSCHGRGGVGRGLREVCGFCH